MRLDSTGAGCLGNVCRRGWHAHRGGRRVPADGVIDLVERFARRAFHGDALRRYAAQEDSAGFRLELKEIGATKEFGARFIFVFQRFAVLAEEMRRVVRIIERQAEHQRSGLRFGVFKHGVAIAFPRR